MIAYEVYVNGVKVCTAGGHELTALSGAVNFFPNRPDRLGPMLTVSGVISQPEEFWHWTHRELHVGDRVEIRVVESSRADDVVSKDRPGQGSCIGEPDAAGNSHHAGK
jgi:hypothetical protein